MSEFTGMIDHIHTTQICVYSKARIEKLLDVFYWFNVIQSVHASFVVRISSGSPSKYFFLLVGSRLDYPCQFVKYFLYLLLLASGFFEYDLPIWKEYRLEIVIL